MNYTIISPLPNRKGKGTFDVIFSKKKYSTLEEAEIADDYVVINLVEDENRVRYFEAYATKDPQHKRYRMLEIQDFPFGIDMFDDMNAMDLAQQFL